MSLGNQIYMDQNYQSLISEENSHALTIRLPKLSTYQYASKSGSLAL